MCISVFVSVRISLCVSVHMSLCMSVSVVVSVSTVAWTVVLSQTSYSSPRLKATELAHQSDG